MAKLLENEIGNLKFLMLGLMFLGVLYLVAKQAKYVEGMSYSLASASNQASQFGHGTANAMRYRHTTGDSMTHLWLRGE